MTSESFLFRLLLLSLNAHLYLCKVGTPNLGIAFQVFSRAEIMIC